jgi:secreted trypsin-like serine protease
MTYCTPADNGFRSTGKIVNGMDAELNSWPGIVSLFLVSSIGSSQGSLCGGTVIDNNYVLTGMGT